MRTLYSGPAVAIVERAGDAELFMGEDDAGEPSFEDFGPRTLLFHPEDDETIAAALAAAPDGCRTMQLHMTAVTEQ